MNIFSAMLFGDPRLLTADLPRRRHRVVVFMLGAFVATIFHGAIASYSLRRTIDADPFSWASANEMTSARSYAREGILALKGLQIVNNPPLGARPDAYTHWPPLFPMLLSRVFLTVGESEAAARGFALFGSVALTAAFFLLVLRCFGSRTALVSLLALVTLPAFAVFTRLVLGVNISLAFMILSLLCYVRATEPARTSAAWASVGCAAFSSAVLFRWEPLLMAPGLLMFTLIARDWKRARLAAAFCATGAAALAVVLGAYLLAAPWLAGELWHTVLYRVGLESYAGQATTLNELPYWLYFSANPTPSLWPWLKECAFRFVHGPGVLGLSATICTSALALRYRSWNDAKTLSIVLTGLLSPWLLWWAVMRNQVFGNGFEIMIAAPSAALCLGLAAEFLAFDLLDTTLAPWALVVVMLIPLWQHIQDVRAETPDAAGIAYSQDIERLTSPDSIVLTPYDGMEPVYYSRRHLVRSISTDSAVRLALERAASSYPNSPVFLAIPTDLAGQFPDSAERLSIASQTDHLVLFKAQSGDLRSVRLAP